MAAKTELFAKWTNGNLVVTDEGESTGARIFVHATDGTDAGGFGSSPETPVATIDYAVALCTAGEGDIIYLMPGHAEDVVEAAAIALDIEGITIIGLGNGDNKATFTFTTATTADIDIDADNITIKNVRFVGDIDALAAPIDVDSAYFRMEDCEFIDNGTDNCVRWILGDANADDMQIVNCVNKGTDTAGNTAWITVNGAANVVVKDCRSNGDFAAANIEVITAAATDILIEGNRLENANAVDVNIEGLASTTGWIANNFCRIATDAQVTWINTPGNSSLFENYGVNNNGETGILIGTPSA